MRASDRKSARKSAADTPSSRVSVAAGCPSCLSILCCLFNTSPIQSLVWLQTQRDAKENPGTPSIGKANAVTPSNVPNSGPGSPRLTLSPRIPSTSAGNLVRHSSNSSQRLGSGLLRQLDVSRSLQAESSHAESSQPGSPTGSVASETASVASESAVQRRRAGTRCICASDLYRLYAVMFQLECNTKLRDVAAAGFDLSSTPQSNARANRTPASTNSRAGSAFMLQQSMDSSLPTPPSSRNFARHREGAETPPTQVTLPIVAAMLQEAKHHISPVSLCYLLQTWDRSCWLTTSTALN